MSMTRPPGASSLAARSRARLREALRRLPATPRTRMGSVMAGSVGAGFGHQGHVAAGKGVAVLDLGGLDQGGEDVGAPLQRQVHRAAVGDLQQAAALAVIKRALQGNL